MTEAGEHMKPLLENAICLGEVYRDAKEEVSALLQTNKTADSFTIGALSK